MSNHVTARRAHTQNQLVDAAIKVFAYAGINGATIEQICDAAGFTRGAFYSNFTSKNDLVLAILDKALESYESALDPIRDVAKAVRSDVPLKELIFQTLLTFFNSQRTDREWVLTESQIQGYAIQNPLVRDSYVDTIHKEKEVLHAYLTHISKEYYGEPLPVSKNALDIIYILCESTLRRAAITADEGRKVLDQDPNTVREVLTPLVVSLDLWASGIFKD